MWKNVAEKHIDALTRKRLNKISSIFSKRLAEKKSKKTSISQKFIEDKGKNSKIQTNTKFALRTTWGSCGVIVQLNVVIA